MLEKICEGVWSAPSPLAVLGMIKLNTRMTVVRMRDGGIWLHSPVAINDELRKRVSQLGEVRYIVAPSCFHHMFVLPWKEAFPNADVYIARGLHKKRKDLAYAGIFEGQAIWPEFAQQTIKGMPSLNEELFFHHDSQTLITTDFLFYMPQTTGFTGMYAWLNGFKQRVMTPIIFRAAIKNKREFLESLQNIRGWIPKTISMCHHYIYTEDAQGAFQQALNRLGVPE